MKIKNTTRLENEADICGEKLIIKDNKAILEDGENNIIVEFDNGKKYFVQSYFHDLEYSDELAVFVYELDNDFNTKFIESYRTDSDGGLLEDFIDSDYYDLLNILHDKLCEYLENK